MCEGEGEGGVKAGQRADELLEPRVVLQLVVARHLHLDVLRLAVVLHGLGRLLPLPEVVADLVRVRVRV